MEYGTPPQLIADEITTSAARDIEWLEAGTEDGEGNTAIEVISLANITPIVGPTANTSATVELTVDNSSVEDPEQLTVLTATTPSAAQQPEWQQREVTISERGDDEITLQTAVDSFSLFAIVETDGNTAPTGTSTAETGGDSSGDLTLFAVVAAGVVGALLIAVPLARRLRSRAESDTEEIDPEETEFEWNPLENS